MSDQHRSTPRAMSARKLGAATLAMLLAACGGGAEDRTTTANAVAEDPFGATGAPGSDMTDNGATDGASGMADNAQGNAAQ